MGREEREIRNGIVDILCFLSSGQATQQQMDELKARMDQAMRVFQKDEAEHAA
jgi:hypothetical protein